MNFIPQLFSTRIYHFLRDFLSVHVAAFLGVFIRRAA